MDHSANNIERTREQRAAFLAAMYDLYIEQGQNLYVPVSLMKAGEKIGLKEWKEIFALATYLEEKNFISNIGGGWSGRMTTYGVDVIEKARTPQPVREDKSFSPTNLVVNAPVVGGIQIHSPHSTQTVSVTLTKIDESVKNLGELIYKCSASELDKEEAIAALDRIRQLAEKSKSPEVLAKANEKLELVKNTIGTAVELSKVAAPYIALLANHFA